MSGAEPRAAAARVIATIRFDGRSLKAALPGQRDPLPDSRDRALCEAIVMQACRFLPRYEAVLEHLLDRPLPKQARVIYALLLAGLAQLDRLGLPAYAAIGSTAEAARVLGQPRLVGLVNALLRRFDRERTLIERTLADDERYRYAHPGWLLDALRIAWPGDWPAVVAANNVEAPLWLRINRRRTGVADYHARLQAAGIEFTTVPSLPAAVILPQSMPATALPGWADGLVSVQDGAAQACITLLDAQPGERVLDACAAPGGKAAALLEAVDVDLVAVERDPARLRTVAQTLQRVGVEATLHAADAADTARWWDGRPFDRILLDAPCSATGVIRRQPDIRLHRRPADVAALAEEQRRLLDALWPLLRPGGRLVYATCSVLPAENAELIDAFLARHPDARALDPGDGFGRVSGRGRQRLPGDDGMDGFFDAVLCRAG